MLHRSIVTHVRHGGSQTCAVEGAYAPRMSRQERRGVLEYLSLAGKSGSKYGKTELERIE